MSASRTTCRPSPTCWGWTGEGPTSSGNPWKRFYWTFQERFGFPSEKFPNVIISSDIFRLSKNLSFFWIFPQKKFLLLTFHWQAPVHDHPCNLTKTAVKISFPEIKNEVFVNLLGYKGSDLIYLNRCKGEWGELSVGQSGGMSGVRCLYEQRSETIAMQGCGCEGEEGQDDGEGLQGWFWSPRESEGPDPGRPHRLWLWGRKGTRWVRDKS